jgi:DNA primase
MMGIIDLVRDLRRAGATSGGEYAGPCPWCGGADRFRVWPEHPSGHARWWCRRCDRRGDTIDLLRERDGLGFREAASAVGKPVDDLRPAPPRRKRMDAPLLPPSTAWRSRAEEVAIKAEEALREPDGARALAYMRGRGFEDHTIRAARLGYVAEDMRDAPEKWGLPDDHRDVWVPRGIVIPWRACGTAWRLNVRRPAGEPKYCGPAGSRNALYGADGLRHGRPVILVEGELDAVAIAQEAGDIVTPVATGSTHGARHPRWLKLLSAAPAILVAFDDDCPGEQAARWWMTALPGVRRLIPVGDPAEMLRVGTDLRSWIADALH